MKILHVASFHGNIGDNANHSGFRRVLGEALGMPLEFENLEIRRFYQKYDGPDRLRFDGDFVAKANSHDLVIFGGGNFFEVWIDTSATGSTIDLAPDIIDALTTKVLFFGLGFDRYKGSSPETLAKFLRFVQHVSQRPNMMLTVRNDGSLNQFRETYGESLAMLLEEVPDGGFFYRPRISVAVPISPAAFHVVLSVAMDMPEVRYGEHEGQTGKTRLSENFARLVRELCTHFADVHCTFVPHIPSDLGAIHEILELVPDSLKRRQVSVGPFLSGFDGADHAFAYYSAASCVVAMRFHATVCSLAMGVPTIGVGTYGKIADLYRGLGLADRLVDGRSDHLGEDLLAAVQRIRSSGDRIRQDDRKVMIELEERMARFLHRVRQFIHA